MSERHLLVYLSHSVISKDFDFDAKSIGNRGIKDSSKAINHRIHGNHFHQIWKKAREREVYTENKMKIETN